MKYNSALPIRRASALTALAILSTVPRFAQATAADQFVYYFNNTTASPSGALGGYSYKPSTNSFYTVGLTNSGQLPSLLSITNTGSSWNQNTLVGPTDDLNFLENADTQTNFIPAGVTSNGASPGAIRLNPASITVGGITYAPNTLGIIVDGNSARLNGSASPALTREVYAYDLRAITYDNIGNYNAPAAGGRDYNGDGVLESNDPFFAIVTLADEQSVNPGVTSTSNTVARQFAFSSSGQSIYYTDTASAFQGLYKVNLTATGATAISKPVSANINCEPAVLASSVRNLGSGLTGDQVIFSSQADLGNAGGLSYIVDGTTVSTPKVFVTAKQIASFNDYTGLSQSILSLATDPATGSVFVEQSLNSRYGGVFQLDNAGRMSKVFSGAEQVVFDQANGATYNANVLKLQVNTVGSQKQLMYKDFGLQSVVGVNLYTPGDFDHNGVVDTADITAFKAHLGLRGAVSGSILSNGTLPTNTDYFTYDLNGSVGTTTGTNTLTASVDWKDAQIFAQYAGISYGDVNMDKAVNQTDFNILATNYNQDGKLWTDGNLTSVRIGATDKDMVNFGDMVTLAANYPSGSKPAITAFGSTVQTDADRAFAVTANGSISQLTATNFNGNTLNWADSSIWSNGIPNAAGAVASLLTKPLNDTTLNLSTSETVGQLNFDSFFTYTLSGIGTLHLAGNNGTSAEINTFAASPIISAAVSLDSATRVTINAQSDIATFSNTISGSGNFTKLGSGTVFFTGANTYTGTTTVSAGTLQTLNSAALPGFNTSGKVSVLAGGNLVVSAGGMTEWTASDIVTLQSKATIASGGYLGIDTTNAAGLFTIKSNLSGTASLNKLGSNTLLLSGTNTYSGQTLVSAGILETATPAALPGYATAGQITVNAGGTLATMVGTGRWTSANIATLLGSATFNTGSSLGIDTSLSPAGFAYSTAITGNTGLTKLGANSLTLSAANTYLGNTNVSGGSLQLNFTGSGVTSNILPVTTTLILANNGGLIVNGVAGSSTALTQSFNSATGAVGTLLNAGGSTIVVNDFGGAPVTLALATLTRNTGGTVDFTLGTSASSTITASAATSNNIIGGWATVSQADWAGKSGSNVIALLSGSYTSDTWSSSFNTTVTTDSSPTAASSTNSLRFNLPAARTITLSGINNIASGGILIAPAVGANASVITGGTLTGARGVDLVVNQFDTAGSLTIGSIIADNNTATALTKSGAGTLALTAANTYTGSTFVNAGQLQISSGSIASTTILVQSGAVLKSVPINALPTTAAITDAGTVNFTGNVASSGGPAALTLSSLAVTNGGLVTVSDPSNHVNRTLLVLSNLTIAGGTDAWSGTLDLAGNDMLVHGGSLANLTNQIKSGFNATGPVVWNGTGLTSSTAKNNPTHLTALGAILNNDGSGNAVYSSTSLRGLFDNSSPLVTDLLVKYTYFGDANLDGKVDGSDYSRIDSGFLSHATGWYNGDFNYDGLVNGSDYTLIDNAYNTQGASIAGAIAGPTAQISAQIAGTTSVPEPAALGLLSLASLRLLSRRRLQAFNCGKRK